MAASLYGLLPFSFWMSMKAYTLIVLVVLASAPFSSSADGQTDLPTLPAFRVTTPCDWQAEVRRTNTWLERDQQSRAGLNKLIQAYPAGIPRAEYDKVAQSMQEDESLLRAELEDLVLRCGWPSKTAFGNRAGENAWLIVQHAPPNFRERYLPLIQAAAEAGELPKSMWALLFDRQQLSRGLPQRYGSQICSKAGGPPQVCDIESVEGIDARRAEVGLVPVSWCAYLSMNNAAHPSCESAVPGAVGIERKPVN